MGGWKKAEPQGGTLTSVLAHNKLFYVVGNGEQDQSFDSNQHRH